MAVKDEKIAWYVRRKKCTHKRVAFGDSVMNVPPKSSIDKISPLTSETIIRKQTATICIILISVSPRVVRCISQQQNTIHCSAKKQNQNEEGSLT